MTLVRQLTGMRTIPAVPDDRPMSPFIANMRHSPGVLIGACCRSGALERMNDKVQRLRRDLTEAIAQPNWTPGYRVRTFTANDAATVYHLLDVGYAQGGGHVGAFEEWWPSLRDDDEFAADLCFLAVDERQNIVGVAQCWTSAFVKDLVVHPLARRRGIAEALLRTVFLEFRHRGEKHVDLKVQVDNPTGAVRLYKKLGMREVPLDRP